MPLVAESSHSASCKEPLRSASRPRLVLRVGLAGASRLAPSTGRLEKAFADIIRTIAGRLDEIAPGTPTQGKRPPGHVARFYSKEHPLLRLTTGLCEGADAMAGRVLFNMSTAGELGETVTTELAAVIPFELGSYRESRPAEFRSEFDEQAARCAYILALDGYYEKPNPDTPRAKTRRGRAYRAQSTVLLRQSDLLVAVADSAGESRTGGTLETVRAALEFGLPVVFLDASTAMVTIIAPGDDAASVIPRLHDGEEDWPAELQRWVQQITADPDSEFLPSAGDYSVKLLEEYFGRLVTTKADIVKNRKSLGERLWDWFIARCKPAGNPPKGDEPIEPYSTFRNCSTKLNYEYSGKYRGAFLLNYTLAAIAVGLAAMTLILLGTSEHTPLADEIHQIGRTFSGDLQTPGPFDSTTLPSAPDRLRTVLVVPTLLLLGVTKLCIVVWIFRNTNRANRGNWNDRAVDYRYLAERLRAMLYLPLIGSFHPPATSPPQHATRAVRQSAIDWLVEAIVRSVSPIAVHFANGKDSPFSTSPEASNVLGLKPVLLLEKVRDKWIWEQSVYHDRQARTMERMYLFTESWATTCNVMVISFVVLDILSVSALLSGWVPKPWQHILHVATSGPVFFAALLPAVVASLNGIRFQSECRRLAERSSVMRTILRGSDRTVLPEKDGSAMHKLLIRLRSMFLIRANEPSQPQPATTNMGGLWLTLQRLGARIAKQQEEPDSDLGSWVAEVLRVVEPVAEAFAQEVAEWSVVYAKELPEP